MGLSLSACISSTSRDQSGVYDIDRRADMDRLASDLTGNRAVLVGETHNRVDHHDLQLAVIQALHRAGHDLAIGVEWFQYPYQDAIDDYLAGRIDEAEMLHRTDYFSRWRFDYRLYRPIIQYARDNNIPLLALNAPKEATDEVSRHGVDKVPKTVKPLLPSAYDRSNDAYRESLKVIFEAHSIPGHKRNFDRFMDVQLTWDETMAEQSARFLKANPEKTLVVLAGTGHVIYGHGIPQRVERRIDVSTAVVVANEWAEQEPESADYFVITEAEELPPSGLMGVFLHSGDEGLVISALSEESGARDAGLAAGDRLVKVNGQAVPHLAALKLVLMTQPPGTSVPVEYIRADPDGQETQSTAAVTLQ